MGLLLAAIILAKIDAVNRAWLFDRLDTSGGVTADPGGDVLRLVKRATDGCVNVFVDAGANTGAHTRILFEPSKHPDSGFLKIFDKVFGADRRLNHTCSLGFEPNSAYWPENEAIQRASARAGVRYCCRATPRRAAPGGSPARGARCSPSCAARSKCISILKLIIIGRTGVTHVGSHTGVT